MTQLWSTLLTFLFAHSQLGRWFSDVFDCLSLFDDVLANPDEMLACRSAQGRRRIEERLQEEAAQLRGQMIEEARAAGIDRATSMTKDELARALVKRMAS